MKNSLILFSTLFVLTSCCTRKNVENRIIDYADFEHVKSCRVYELPKGTDSLVIQNVPIGSVVYITKTNTGSSIIPKESAQYVLHADGITLNVKNPKEHFENRNLDPTSVFAPQKIFRKTEKVKSFDAETEQNKKKSKLIKEKLYEIGNQKDIYIDTNSNMSTYEKKSAHLAAKGSFCYVWAVDGYGSEDKIKSSAEILCNAFDGMYDKIRLLFGKESDAMFCNFNGKFFEMKNLEYMSDTGRKVNIVLYDINMANNGVVGYFYSKDYFPSNMDYENDVLKYSNEGKYIYIDSQWAEADIDICISTLAHEFQHIINYNQKTLLHNLPDADAFSEMMALICEDIIKGRTENESLNSRLAMFNSGYAECGLEYRGDSHYHAMLSYAMNYAFGTWLYHNYGGTTFIHNIATNAYSDIKCITHASGKSIDQLLKAFSIDCISKENGFSYLWNLHKTNYDEADYKYDGPVTYAYNARHEIRPYGIFLIKTGMAESDTLLFKFNRKEFSNQEHTYIVVE